MNPTRSPGLWAGSALLLLSCCNACSPGQNAREAIAEAPSTKVVLSVGEQQITLEQLNQFFSSRIGELSDHTDMDGVKSRLLEDFIEEQLLDQEAQKLGIAATDEEVNLYLRELEGEKTKDAGAGGIRRSLQAEVMRRVRIHQYIGEHLTQRAAPDPAEIQKYYAGHADEFEAPETVHVKEILVSSADQAERVMGLLRAEQYKNFSQLARLYSIAPSSANGGDMGVFARGDLPEEMEKVFFTMRVPGRVSPIIQTKYGYHVFQLVQRVQAYRQRFEEVRDRIANLLVEQQQKQQLAEKIRQLRSEVPVTLYRENLDFSYNGSEFPGGAKP